MQQPAPHSHYAGRQSIGLGITLVVVGGLSVLFAIIAVGIAASKSYGIGDGGHGFWCGLVYIATGVLGIVAGQRKTKGLITAFLVMAIISTVFAFIQFFTAASIAGVTGAAAPEWCKRIRYHFRQYGQNITCDTDWLNGIVAMEALLAVIALVAIVASIWGSVICCKGGGCACCCPSTAQPPAQTVVYTQPQQPVVVAQGPGYPPAYGQQPPPQAPVEQKY